MVELLTNLQSEQALLITAPPGWGKTYKLLDAISISKRKTIFIFPLRALCDEVFFSAEEFGINCCNCRSLRDFKDIEWDCIDLVLTTPECLDSNYLECLPREVVIIFDECHLIYYWGETFRQKLIDTFLDCMITSLPLIFLSATMSDKLIAKLKADVTFNYPDFTQINLGNQELKNLPSKIYFYPKVLGKLLNKEVRTPSSRGVTLVFCEFRDEVSDLRLELEDLGYSVLSCVGGEAGQFMVDLQHSATPEYIVATSVVSHGVNLPRISRIIFTYEVGNIDYYLQMVGRGGRDGSEFEIHTFDRSYFNGMSRYLMLLPILFKSISNTAKSYLYYLHAC